MVLKNSPNAKESAGFVNYLLSEEAQSILVADGGVGVVRDGVEWPPVLADAYASAKNATALSGFGGGLGVSYPEFNATVLTPEFSKMFLGQSTPEDFVKVLVERTKAHWASQQ
jgi:ABC-type glycerol-3-phosphate transport system substrate-binding protein